MRWGFSHHYASLPASCHLPALPTPVAAPRLLLFNDALASELGLDPVSIRAVAAEALSGNALPEDAQPLAMAYAGHQFGNFVPQLGDGRALLLGELRDRSGALRDLHLKGSGRTGSSRGGDGRAAVGPMLREYVISEALHALGIPTTRSLAVVATGEPVYRERPLPGAVLARVAASHLRVGSFEFLAARGDLGGLQALLAHVIQRHDPEAAQADCPALAVLEGVAARQARLVAHWLRVGFIHGVMNTDNMTLSGESIDFGPCAFLDDYHPRRRFSSIDHQGRYAFMNQPGIAQWNLARLAECLLPLIDPEEPERAVSRVMPVLEGFIHQFDALYQSDLRRKLGLAGTEDGDVALAQSLLQLMQEGRADFTLAWRGLGGLVVPDSAALARWRGLFGAEVDVEDWLMAWRARRARDPAGAPAAVAMIEAASPAVIPRNHQVEAALRAANEDGDLAPVQALLAALRQPYTTRHDNDPWLSPPRPGEEVHATFCGT